MAQISTMVISAKLSDTLSRKEITIWMQNTINNSELFLENQFQLKIQYFEI